MSSERWQRLDRVFIEALQLSPEHREQFLAQEAARDSVLAREAHALLAAAGESGQFMERPALERLARVIADQGWSLRPGVRVGAYTITQMLGSGGVGEVWRARDERLSRDVAIKVLLPQVSENPEGLRRLIDEARTAGALNHANLLTVYDVGEHNGVPFLVSECLEGQSLRQRLAAGPIQIEEVVRVALGISAGLTAAHRRGIVHRDLKPENVFLRSDGGIKILDFGLAKLQLAAGRPGDTSHALSSAIVGTAGYMAPEQVRGEDVDARADLFALGVTLYEMLAGQHPFRKGSTFETLQAILTSDPPPIANSAQMVPVRLMRVVMRLLEKNPAARFQSASDLAWALEQSLSTDAPPSPVHGPSATRPRAWGRWLAGGAIAAVVAGVLWVRGTTTLVSPGTPAVTRFTWALPAGVGLDSAPVVSPDSRYIAFTGIDSSGARLYIRALDAFDAHAVPGSDGARQPFWSPDSQWVGFFSRQRLMKVPIAGGAPLTIVEAIRSTAVGTRRTEQGGSWSRTGQIVYGADHGEPSLSRVSADGGAVAAATVLARDNSRHRFPSFLPDGLHFLFFAGAATEDRRGVYVASIDEAPRMPQRRLLQSESEAAYVFLPAHDIGVLLYVPNGRVHAQPFDPVRRELVGDAQSLPIDAAGPTLYHSALLGASPDVLAYSPSPIVVGNRISSIAEDGGGFTVVNERELQQWPRVSRDGRFLAWLRIDPVVPNADVWVEDLARRTRVRVTTALGRDLMHVWSPDGSRLVYRPEFADPRRLNIIAADGSGTVEALTCPRAYCEPTDWSSDGRSIIVNAYDGENVDVWSVGTTADVASQALLADPFAERDARVSPDRRWIAYVSDETGRTEVSIRSVVDRPRRYVISPGGGSQPVWHPSGRGLYYVDARGLLRKVAIQETNGALTFGQPAELKVPPIGSGHASTQYDVSADGRIYFLDQRAGASRPTEIRIIVGWSALLSKELLGR
jgi:serine/threonine protein kinase/Tol biopolymer transport system component